MEINIAKYPDKKLWSKLCKRPQKDTGEILSVVKEVFDKIISDGDGAVKTYTKQFDKAEIEDLKVSPSEIEKALKNIDQELISAMKLASSNIKAFHEKQRVPELRVETMAGVECWRRQMPINNVGLYIPGGTAPLFSTVLMLGIPAVLAGCKNIALFSPPNPEGKLPDSILAAASICGIENIYKIGGIQAVAAMAVGTDTIEKVDKIFGPGNQYVTSAKQYAQQNGVAIDMPAGPSEVLLIADKSANPEFIAADLISQAEHGVDSQVILVTWDENIIDKTQTALENQLRTLPRGDMALASLKNSQVILVKDESEAIAFSNHYAPEHLIINCEDAELIADEITDAGSVFIGQYTPESAGDYASGTNHTLPTSGYAKSYSGVSLDSYMKNITYQKITKEGLKSIGPAIETMAIAEQLDGHAQAVTLRLKQIKTEETL